MSFPSNTRMDFFVEFFFNNYNEVRDKSLSTKKNISRNLLMSSMKSSVTCYKRMEHNNAMVIDKEMDNISSALSYEKK